MASAAGHAGGLTSTAAASGSSVCSGGSVPGGLNGPISAVSSNLSAASQQFCLKWNNHTSNLVRTFTDMISDENFVDVTLACDGIYIKAHKMVLSACSNYFKELFMVNPCKHPIVILKDMKFEELRAIIDFMYKGEVNVSQNQLGALLKTAEVLRVKGLTEVNEGNDSADVKPPLLSASSSHVATNSSHGHAGLLNGLEHNELPNGGPSSLMQGISSSNSISADQGGLSVSAALQPLPSIHNVTPANNPRKRRKRPRVIKREPAAASIAKNNVQTLPEVSSQQPNLVTAITTSSATSTMVSQMVPLENDPLANLSDTLPSDEETVDIPQAVAANNAKRQKETFLSAPQAPSTTGHTNNNLLPPPLLSSTPPLHGPNETIQGTFSSNPGTPTNSNRSQNRRTPLSQGGSQPAEAVSADGSIGDAASNDSADQWAAAQMHSHGSHHHHHGGHLAGMDNGDRELGDDSDDEMIDVKPIISFDDGGGGSSQHSIDNMMSQSMALTPDGGYGGASQENSQGSQGKICVCHLCHLTFTAYSSLRRHMARHYADRERYECDICFKSYSRKDYLKEHKKLKHSMNT